MSQTINELALEVAKIELGNVSLTNRSCYVSIMALRQICAEREEAFKINIANHPQPSPLDLGKALSHTFTSIRGSGEFLSLRAALDYTEALPEVIQAIKVVSPLVEKVRKLEAAIHDERDAANLAANALREAEDAARQAAEAKLAKDPAIIAARKAFEQAQPALVAEKQPDPPLVRGVIKNRPQLEVEALVADD